MKTGIPLIDLATAVQTLTQTVRGREAIVTLHDWLHVGPCLAQCSVFLGLDAEHRQAVLTILDAAWGELPELARDALQDAVDRI